MRRSIEKTNQDVEKYIQKQKSPQREIVEKLRQTILKTIPDVKEEFKMGVPWYEGKFYLVALKDHVNLGFSVDGLSVKDLDLFEGKGKMMRHIKFRSLEETDKDKVTEIVKLVAEKSKKY